MNQQEHLQEARELMDWSQEVTESGRNPRIAAELLWGSFAHCLITVALNDGLPHDSHGAFRNIARHLGHRPEQQPLDFQLRGSRKAAPALLSRRPDEGPAA